jgi:predicted O-methyltransferase YrrM
LNKKILEVISSLARESDRQRNSKREQNPDREMMAITHDTGLFFSVLLQAIRARQVLEIGTSSGYSTLWFADALLARTKGQKPPLIITIDSNPAKVRWAKDNFAKAGVGSIIQVIGGEATPVLNRLAKSKSKFDFVFIDADKENIISYFSLALPMVRVGGIIAADNMLLPEHFRPQMQEYASFLANRNDVETVTVPIGMGEEITVRIR